MSTLAVTTIQTPGGTVPTETLRRGSAKAWGNFNGTGTVALRDSFNVSSIVDNNAGDYSPQYTAARADADYAVTAQANVSATVAGLVWSPGVHNLATGSFRMTTGGTGTTAQTPDDNALISFILMD